MNRTPGLGGGEFKADRKAADPQRTGESSPMAIVASHSPSEVVMKALMFHDRRDLRLEEVPTPEPGPGEAQIRVTDAGLSQTQVNEFMEGPFIISQDTHPLTGHHGPLIPCQEYGGVVSAVGPDVDPELIGTQVAVLPAISCGTCVNCRLGRDNICEVLAYRGLVGADGGFAEYNVASTDELIPIDDRNMLTFVEPLLLGVHTSKRTERPHDGRVLVVGAGAVGCAIAAVWQDCLGTEVVVHDVLPGRVQRARAAGLEATTDVPEPGDFSVVIEAAGKDPVHEAEALPQAIGLVAPGGTVLALGAYFSSVVVQPLDLVFAERAVVPSFAYARSDVEDFMVWKDKLHVDFGQLVSRVSLENLVEDGYYQAELDRDVFTRYVTSVDG